MDIANLVIAVDATQAGQAAGTLDQLSQAGQRAQTAAGGLSRAHAQVAESVRRMTAEEYRAVQAIERFALASSRLSSSSRAVTVSAGQMRSGMQQLGFQVNDIAQGFAMGVSPMTIWAQQGGQVMQSIQLMNGGASGFARFMGGPWGIGITAGVTVLGSLIAGLLHSESAAEQAQRAAEEAAHAQAELGRVGGELGEAQSILGRMFDLATGKLSNQNEVVREAIRLQAVLARIEADRLGQEAGRRLAGMSPNQFVDARGRPMNIREAGLVGGYTGGDPNFTAPADNPGVAAFRSLVQGFRGNPGASVRQFRQSLEALQRNGQLSGVDINSAVNEAVTIANQRQRYQTFGDVQRVADGAPLPASLMRPRTGGGGRTGGRQGANDNDRTAEQRFQVHIELLRAEQENLDAQMGVTQSANVTADQARRRVQTEAQIEGLQLAERLRKGEIDKAEAKQLMLLNNSTRDARLRNITAQERDGVAREQLSINQADLRTETEIARYREQMATTAAERRDSQLELLALSQRQERADLKAVLASETAAPAEQETARRRLASMDRSAAFQTAIIGRDTESPMERYMREMRATTADVRSQVEGIQVRAFDNLADAIAGVVSGTESLGHAFKDMARGIVSDIIQMTVRMLIFRAVSGLFGGGSSSYVSKDGFMSFSGGYIGFAPPRAAGGPVGAGMPYFVGERGPELFVPSGSGKIVPTHQLAANRNAPIELIIHSAPSDDAWVKIDDISAHRAGQAVQVSVQHTNDTLRSAMRPKLNGTGR